MAVSLRYLITLCILGAALLATSAHAQSPAGGARVFTVLGGGEADWQGISWQRTTADATELAISPRRRSAELKGAGDSVIFTRARMEATTGKLVRVPVARAAWPSGVRTALFVLVPRRAPAADGMEFDVLAADEGAEVFPAESFRILNLTAATLTMAAGGREAQIAPGVSPVVRLADVSQAGQGAAALALGVRSADGGMVPVYLGPLEVKPGSRVLAVVYPPRGADARKVRVVLIGQTAPSVK